MGSYPTYEEWKLNPAVNNMFIYLGSYPTYEEWKLDKVKKGWEAKAPQFLSYL